MKTKEELNAMQETLKASNTNRHELLSSELEQVTGGFSQNEDGTYNIYKGDGFVGKRVSYTALVTCLNATLRTEVLCDMFDTDADGNYLNVTTLPVAVKYLIQAITGKYIPY